MHRVKIIKLSSLAIIPEYAKAGDAGLDLFSTEEKTLEMGEICLIHTGISIELPDNTEAQIRPRSGLALKYGITVLNSPGTIDQGFRGEIGVILINLGKEPFQVEINMRIAQLVIKPIYHVEMQEVEFLSDSQRGAQGFGSTGLQSRKDDDSDAR